MHVTHCGADALAANLPPSHCLQPVALAPLCVPAEHEVQAADPAAFANWPAAQFLQNAWLTSFWNLPFGQEAHVAEFDALENVPTAHSPQTRLAVLDGVAVTFAPAAQTVCAMQKVFFASPWNSITPQIVQICAFVVSENLPDGQSTQRSSKMLELSDSNVPGVHWSLTSQ